MRVLILLMALCAFTIAMVPKEKRAVDVEEKQSETVTVSSSTNSGEPLLCQPHTPCGWSIYKPLIKIIDTYVTNSYCICGPGLECIINEDDKSVNSYVHRCRAPNTTTDIDFGTR